jgi:KEOPS complex subunit Cgi121
MTTGGAAYEIRAAVLDGCRPEDLIRRIRVSGLQPRCRIICFDADRMAGRRHVEAAVCQGIRAWDEGTSIADSLEMEVLLYAGGTRQTSLGRNFGLTPNTRNLYLCFIPPCEEATTEMLQWVRFTEDHDENLSEEKVRRLADLFGITRAECETVGKDRIPELVIERVALLNVYK